MGGSRSKPPRAKSFGLEIIAGASLFAILSNVQDGLSKPDFAEVVGSPTMHHNVLYDAHTTLGIAIEETTFNGSHAAIYRRQLLPMGCLPVKRIRN
ncbi:hypothetical protein PLANPX_3782 [Lacipirellula parvula]|uniref:Uncharacterized protein n=2 Tax=Lacipirellula parvula TaxID=2650471 RepID=A0A5K7XBJ7_9BACT|nr:hypothetical protein PLANPX_3782 [Lacipirellula parvula]